MTHPAKKIRRQVIMVREIRKNGEKLYACEICKLLYKEKAWTEKCQDFCEKYNACSLGITSRAVNVAER